VSPVIHCIAGIHYITGSDQQYTLAVSKHQQSVDFLFGLSSSIMSGLSVIFVCVLFSCLVLWFV